MKICFLAGANSIHSYRWVKYFLERGHNVTWISLAPSIFEPLAGVQYIEVLDSPTVLGILRMAMRARRAIREAAPDILHIHSVGTYGVVGLFSGFAPTVVTPWGSDVIFGKKSLWKRFFIRRVLRKASTITCDALHMLNEIIDLGVSADKINIINFGIDTDRFSPIPSSSDIRNKYRLGNAITVISLRNFEPVYDISTLLQAIPKVLEYYPEVIFMLVGRGSLERELKSIVNKLGISNAVRFVGFVNNSELPDTLCSMDIYVSTSLSDAGIAASTAEAMACELPVVITDSGENIKWIDDGEQGYIIPVSQPDILADRIGMLISNADIRQKMGKAGRSIIRERNDYKVEMAKMDNLYEETINKHDHK